MSKDKMSFKKYIAGVLIASIVGGGMIGVGIGVVESFTKQAKKQASVDQNAFSFSKLNVNSTVDYSQLKYVPETTTTDIKNTVGPAIVYIESTVVASDYFNRATEAKGSGSGIIYKTTADKYYIVTNNHVIDGAKKVNVTFEGGQIIEAKIAGADSASDLAVIQVNKADMTEATLKAIKVAQFGNSDDIQVGEQAVAIGNPLGSEFENSVTQGIISALNRQIQVDDRNLTVIQTDAAINPGNSGGALVNSKGQVIGINSVKITLTEVEGMGFAIPTKVAVPIFEDLITNGAIQRPQLGIKGSNVTQDIGEIYALPTGVYVAEVLKGSSAEAAGIMAKDIITDFNGEKILSMEQLSSLIKECKVGDTVEIRIVRNGKTAKTLKTTLQAGK
jgi:serine protease Do